MLVIDGASVLAAVAAAYLKLGRLGFLLLGMCVFLAFSLYLHVGGQMQHVEPLDGPLSVEVTRFAVGARVRKLVTKGLITTVRVVAVYMLPTIACLAVDGAAIVVRVFAYAFDAVGLLIFDALELGDGVGCQRSVAGGEEILTGSHAQRGQLFRHHRVSLPRDEQGSRFVSGCDLSPESGQHDADLDTISKRAEQRRVVDDVDVINRL